jgi:cell shape-determining protein MreD
MQKIATRVFIYSSIAFGVLGIYMVLTGTDPDENSTGLDLVITKLFMSTVFIILTSFAISVASKYLNGKS